MSCAGPGSKDMLSLVQNRSPQVINPSQASKLSCTRCLSHTLPPEAQRGKCSSPHIKKRPCVSNKLENPFLPLQKRYAKSSPLPDFKSERQNGPWLGLPLTYSEEEHSGLFSPQLFFWYIPWLYPWAELGSDGISEVGRIAFQTALQTSPLKGTWDLGESGRFQV